MAARMPDNPAPMTAMRRATGALEPDWSTSLLKYGTCRAERRRSDFYRARARIPQTSRIALRPVRTTPSPSDHVHPDCRCVSLGWSAVEVTMPSSVCATEAEPLAMHRVLETEHLSEVRELTSRLLGADYSIEALDPSQAGGAKLNAVSLGEVQVGYLETGGPVRFALDEFANSYMICIQLVFRLSVTH